MKRTRWIVAVAGAGLVAAALTGTAAFASTGQEFSDPGEFLAAVAEFPTGDDAVSDGDWANEHRWGWGGSNEDDPPGEADGGYSEDDDWGGSNYYEPRRTYATGWNRSHAKDPRDDSDRWGRSKKVSRSEDDCHRAGEVRYDRSDDSDHRGGPKSSKNHKGSKSTHRGDPANDSHHRGGSKTNDGWGGSKTNDSWGGSRKTVSRSEDDCHRAGEVRFSDPWKKGSSHDKKNAKAHEKKKQSESHHHGKGNGPSSNGRFGSSGGDD